MVHCGSCGQWYHLECEGKIDSATRTNLNNTNVCANSINVNLNLTGLDDASNDALGYQCFQCSASKDRLAIKGAREVKIRTSILLLN
jgi:hypothetical protein